MGRSSVRFRSKVAWSPQETGKSSKGGALVALFYLLSFGSGVSALVYEVTWAKMLALAFGSTTLSTGAVVAGFMGGMGLGARLYHLIYDRYQRAVLIYALLEIAIAVTTALLTLAFYALPRLFAQVSGSVPSGFGLGVLRVAVVFLLLVVPSALMGATFPALCTVIIRKVRDVDHHLGLIYGINTIGAAAGALLAGLLLIERLGLQASVTVANVINVTVGVAALGLLRTGLGRGGMAPAEAKKIAIATSLPAWLTGIVLLGSGFATLSYEIIWFRALRYIVGNSTYALTTVLVIFLVGLGLGSLVLRRVLRRGSPEGDLVLCQCAIAILALAAMGCELLMLSQPALRDAISIFSVSVQARPWWWRLLVDAAAATVAMLPATLCMGLSFPLASRLFLGDISRLSKRIGGAYLLANLGSILGSLLAAVVLLPLYGTVGGTKFVAVINLTLGIAVALWIRRQAPRYLRQAAVATVIVMVLVCVLPSSISLHGETIEGIEADVVFVEEGDLATVQVLVKPGEPNKKVTTIDGYMIGWSSDFKGDSLYEKQVLLAHLPMVLDTRIRQTLNIGLGSGGTLYALASYPELETLDCVEISAAVVRAFRFFEESSVLTDSRVNLIVDDAVHYLLRTDRQYDLIISDGKQHPFFSGNAPLLAREFYEYARSRLTDHGLFVQWLPLGTLAVDFRINLRTSCEVFPYVEVFYYPRESVLMVASLQPPAERPPMSPEEFRRGPTYADLETYGIVHPASLLSFRAAGKTQMQEVLGDGAISTWDHMLLDFTVFKADASDFAPWDPSYGRSGTLVRLAFLEYLADRRTSARVHAERAVQANPADEVAQGVALFMRLEEQKARAHRPPGEPD